MFQNPQTDGALQSGGSPAPGPGAEAAGAEATGGQASGGDPVGTLESLADSVTELTAFLPDNRALKAAVLVAVFLILARLTSFLLTRVITRATRKTQTQVDDQIIALLHRPVFISVFFFGLALAAHVLILPDGVTRVTIRVLATLVVWVWLVFGIRFGSLLLAALSRHQERLPIVEERTIPLFDNLGKIVLVAGASYAALLIWEIDATAWLTSAGIIGIAVGFAAKDTLANLFSGVFIIADAPYKLGDFVVLGTGDRGMVTHVGIRSTRILTRDDVEITVPNAVIANATIINESGGRWEKTRLRVKVGVAYGSDVDQVCEVLEGVAKEMDGICPAPEPRVRFRAFGSSSLDFELLCWIDQPVARGKTLHLLHIAVYKAFQKEGIEIPFPQQDVYVRQLPAAASTE